MSDISFAPGETNIFGDKFSPSLVLFWLKTEIATTNARIVVKMPNTLMGLIPLGYKDEAYPLSNVASVGVEVKFSLGRAFFGAVFTIIGLATLFKVPVLGLIFLLLGVPMVLNAMSAALKVQNNGGAVSFVQVSILEKAKLEALRNEINSRLFADHQGLRHQEAMGYQQMSLINQQAQLTLQQQQQQ